MQKQKWKKDSDESMALIMGFHTKDFPFGNNGFLFPKGVLLYINEY